MPPYWKRSVSILQKVGVAGLAPLINMLFWNALLPISASQTQLWPISLTSFAGGESLTGVYSIINNAEEGPPELRKLMKLVQQQVRR
jgi:hypothetical protein